MSRANLTEMHTLEDLARWAASNHRGGFMPSDWMPLLLQAQLIAIRELKATMKTNEKTDA